MPQSVFPPCAQHPAGGQKQKGYKKNKEYGKSENAITGYLSKKFRHPSISPVVVLSGIIVLLSGKLRQQLTHGEQLILIS